ncbi:membrane protein involved in the export of O-antigen and teichoic acid [Frankia torreyi]|uniref:Membrane protein involved in the export of O-antigen and teichoic acid n=2 Tax=Frankia TaxID=1854 RepID=A0A0D8BN40_9ACTN|nr:MULTISPECIES: oligosaccharide flippase family protein [Frankia]KJE25623.1 membrane protein involved in the export of O-antigen and teichoic acid [Frankia torreyi]
MERDRGYLAGVRASAATSLTVTVVGAGMSVLLARLLGPAGRGAYAVVTSYALAAAAVGECGLTAAICFFVARDPRRAPDVVRTGGALLLALGAVVGVSGFFAASLVLPHDHAAATAFRVVFAAQPIIFVSACWVFALQATRLAMWNLTRAVQPLLHLAGIGVLAATVGLTLGATVACLLVSITVQAALAALLWRLDVPDRGRIRRREAHRLLRYGAGVFLSTLPYLLSTKLDILLLALLVEPAKVGYYAVAVSMSLVSQPICVAFGNVAMPRLARQGGAADADRTPTSSRRTAMIAVGASLACGIVVIGAMSALAPLVVPLVLGARYAPSVHLLWLLAPGAALLGCNRVTDDVLRGLDRALTVARCEGVGSVLTVVGLAVLVPVLGIEGAAIASSVAYTASFLLLFRAVLRAVDVSARTVPARAYGLLVARAAGMRRPMPLGGGR